MVIFSYAARTDQGKLVDGKVQADTRDEAIAYLNAK